MATATMLNRLILTAALVLTATPSFARAEAPAAEDTAAKKQREWKTLGLVSGGVGLMFLTGAAAYKNASSHGRDEARIDPTGLGKDLLRQSDEHAHTAVVLGIVGASALVGGALAYLIGGRERSRSQTALVFTPVLPVSGTAGQYSGFALSAKF